MYKSVYPHTTVYFSRSIMSRYSIDKESVKLNICLHLYLHNMENNYLRQLLLMLKTLLTKQILNKPDNRIIKKKKMFIVTK